jgi:hypothetical protein
MVEQLTLNQLVEGSSPSRCTIHSLRPVSRPAEAFPYEESPGTFGAAERAAGGSAAGRTLQIRRSRIARHVWGGRARGGRIGRRPNATDSTKSNRPGRWGGRARGGRIGRRPNATDSTKSNPRGRVAELADALDLGSSGETHQSSSLCVPKVRPTSRKRQSDA